MTHKAEQEFLKTLERKAQEQKRLAKTTLMPEWAVGMGEWLVVNPWRVLIPVAVIVYLAARLLGGSAFRELVLAIFGGFAR